MITARDLVRLPWTQDLTGAGLVIARRGLLNFSTTGGGRRYDAVRRSLAAAALDITFRRYLTSRSVPFDVSSPTPFLNPDRYDVRVGARTCDLKTYLISRTSDWNLMQADPQLILDAPALVPLDRHVAGALRARDAYVFGMAGAAIPEGTRGTPGMTSDGFWIHLLPPAWQRIKGKAPLGPVHLRAESSGEWLLELGGLDLNAQPTEFVARLVDGERLVLPNSFLALSHLGARRRPIGRIGIHLPAHHLKHVVEPGDWRNVWLAGWGMILLGWMSREEFQARAELIPAGRRVLQFERTKMKNLAVPVASLRPMAMLMAAS